MRLNLKKEKSIRGWLLRSLVGPAYIIDGIVNTFTLSSVNSGCALNITKKLAMVRIKQ